VLQQKLVCHLPCALGFAKWNTRSLMRRTAASAYAEQTRSAIASIQREYGLPAPGSSRNVFSWSCRPDVRAISDIMCSYIKEWDYRQVRQCKAVAGTAAAAASTAPF
jgi:hypothetical protein